MLKLYVLGNIDVGAWLKSEEAILINPSEEFSIEYCLYRLLDTNPHIEKLKQIKVYKNDENDELDFKDADNQNIRISDFIIEVTTNHG